MAERTIGQTAALVQLKRVIKEAPDKLWDMRHINDKRKCGTAHCALGWAMVDKWFKKNTEIAEDYGFGKAAKIFGLSEIETDLLFAAEICPLDSDEVTKEEVLENIDRLLNGKKPLVYKALSDQAVIRVACKPRGDE